jgi:hypothetical protein
MSHEPKQRKLSGPLSDIRAMAEAIDALCREIKANQISHANRVAARLRGDAPDEGLLPSGLEPVDGTEADAVVPTPQGTSATTAPIVVDDPRAGIAN